jgi:hypothetical protein
VKRAELLLAVLAIAAPAAPALASTTISPESGSSYPYQRWVDRSTMPTPDVELKVVEGGCSWHHGDPGSCTYAEARTIWMTTDRGRPKQSFFHELGHNFDYFELGAGERGPLLARMGLAQPWRQDGPRSPHELFAEAFQQCATGHAGEGGVVGPARLKRVCRQIRRSY